MRDLFVFPALALPLVVGGCIFQSSSGGQNHHGDGDIDTDADTDSWTYSDTGSATTTDTATQSDTGSSTATPFIIGISTPHPYSINESLAWDVVPPAAASSIELYVTGFESESTFDYLRVYNQVGG